MTDSNPTAGLVDIDLDEVRFRTLVDNSPDAICVHEAGRVVYLNPAGVRWIAAESADQLIGCPITDFVHPDSVPGMLARLATLRDYGDASAPAEATLLRFGGKTLDVEVISVLTTWEGRPAHQVVFRDLTAQEAQATLRYQAALVEHVSDAIIGTSPDGVVTAWNPAAETIYQQSAEQVCGQPIAAAVGAPLDPAQIVAAGGVQHTTHHTPDGRTLAIRVSAATMESGYVLVCSDRTALRRAEQHFQTVVNSLHRGVMVIDPDGRIESANPAALRILGRADQPLNSQVDLATIFPGHGPDGQLRIEAQQPVAITRRTGRPVRDALLDVVDNYGRRIWLSVTTCLLDPNDPEGSGILVSFEDVTAQHLASERLRHNATHDTLTDLPNRASITDQITGALAGIGSPPLAAVIFIDLDQLKEVNDTLGHHAGDAVIRVCAERFTGALRARDTVARIGGDEFVILIAAPATVDDLEQIAHRLHATLADPIRVESRTVHASASIGIAVTGSGETRVAAEILRHADIAMYQAKSSGRGQTRFWAAEDDLAV